MDLRIGAEVVFEGNKYKVIESLSCGCCAFAAFGSFKCDAAREKLGHCSALLRKDGRAIAFIKV